VALHTAQEITRFEVTTEGTTDTWQAAGWISISSDDLLLRLLLIYTI